MAVDTPETVLNCFSLVVINTYPLNYVLHVLVLQ